jgi:hypothetical protein
MHPWFLAIRRTPGFSDRRNYARREYRVKLSIQELATAKTLLARAHALIAGVSASFFGAGDGATSARLNDVAHRLADEIRRVDKLMMTPGAKKP